MGAANATESMPRGGDGTCGGSGPVRPRILFLAQCLPYPPEAGVTKRTYNVLIELQKEFDVLLVAYSRRAHQPDTAARVRAREELASRLYRVAEPVLIGREHSRVRLLWDQFRSALSARPYTYFEYESSDVGPRLRDITFDRAPALVHMDSLDLYGLLPELPGGPPIACTHHSVESELLARSARHLPFRPMAWYYRHQAHLIEKIERRLCPRFDLNVMMSESDERKLREIAPGARTVVVPNAVDTHRLQPADETRRRNGRIVFVGGTYSLPNRDGVDYFIREIWPLITAQASASLEVVGRSDTRDPLPSPARGVTFAGHVPDIREPLSTAMCSVVPLRIGGGTRLKILDAWAMGTPVVSTSIGCEGLDARDGENILIRDQPAEFAAAVVRVLQDDRLRRRLSEAGREMVVRSYSWEKVGERLRSAYWELLA